LRCVRRTRLRQQQRRRLHGGCGNHGREEHRRIRLQRHLHVGLRDSWTYSSTLKTALFGANIRKQPFRR
jgi:hypothetical protein